MGEVVKITAGKVRTIDELVKACMLAVKKGAAGEHEPVSFAGLHAEITRAQEGFVNSTERGMEHVGAFCGMVLAGCGFLTLDIIWYISKTIGIDPPVTLKSLQKKVVVLAEANEGLDQDIRNHLLETHRRLDKVFLAREAGDNAEMLRWAAALLIGCVEIAVINGADLQDNILGSELFRHSHGGCKGG